MYKENIIYTGVGYAILGEIHNRNIPFEKEKLLFTSYIPDLKELARLKGIYFESFSKPESNVQKFLSKYGIKGKFLCWEPVKKQTAIELALLDLFGGDFNTLFKQINVNRTTKTILEIIQEYSDLYSYNGKSIDPKVLKQLVTKEAIVNTFSTNPYNKSNLKLFHNEGQYLSFEVQSSKLYKIQELSNIQRGIHLGNLTKKKGGLFFVSADHLSPEFLRKYKIIL